MPRNAPLGWAARGGQVEFVRFLLGRDAGLVRQPDAVPEWADPIEWARRSGHAEIVALLS
ncbi:MAG: ankyrin repeat domain-containing protein [bacterium]|nr:ankyrin repeat domain-containing protein [bacterium]